MLEPGTDVVMTKGYKANSVSFILSKEKINTVEGGRSQGQNWQSYYDDELKNSVRKKERYLFEIFPEYDV